MKNRTMFCLLIATTMIFSACSWFGGENEPEVDYGVKVQEGISNLTEIKSATYELTLSGKVETEDSETFEFEVLDLVLSFSGGYDATARENPKFAMKIAAAGSTDGEEQEKAYGELRIVNNNFYFVLSEISDFAGQLPKEMVEPFLGKWWSVPLPADYINTFNTYSGDDSEPTPEEEEIKELFKNTIFFKDVEYVREEDLAGTTTLHYRGALDKEAITNYTIESGKIMGTLTADNVESTRAEMLSSVENLEVTGDIWIGKDDNILRQWKGNFKLEDLEDFDGSLKFEMTYSIDNLNEPVEVEVPENAEVFDLFSLLFGPAAGSLGGLEGGFEGVEDLEGLAPLETEGELDFSGYEDLASELEGLSTDEEFLKSLEDLSGTLEGFE